MLLALSIGLVAYFNIRNEEVREETELTKAEHEVIEVMEPMPYEIKEMYAEDMFNDRYSKLDLFYLAANIYIEAKYESDYKQRIVGSVALNRAKSANYPNDLVGVFEQQGQYSGMIEGTARRIIEIFENNEEVSEEKFLELERCVENAEYLLENGSIIDEDYVFQATFEQGYDCFYVEGDWIGKER